MKQPRHTLISNRPIILLAAVLLALGLFALVRCNTPPVVVTVTPVVVTVTPSATATSTPKPSISPSVTIAPPTATVTPDLPPMTATPTVSITEIVPTATPATPLPTPDLLGTHRVRRGDTMWGIGLQWYPRRWFLWAEHVWRPVCDANPQIVDCRMIFPGDVLAIPRLR